MFDMQIDPRKDGHVHTKLCHHAVGRMEDYVLSAIKKELPGICFLEHMEEGIISSRTTWLTENDFDVYFAEGLRLQEKYHKEISIELGVEVGFNPEKTDILLRRLSKRSWNRIGISYHFHRLAGSAEHLNLIGKSDKAVHRLSLAEAAAVEREYYLNLIAAVHALPGNVLCHLDAVLRHYPRRSQLEPPWQLIESLLENVKKRGMAIEINTSGLAIRGEVFPCRQILALVLQKEIPLLAGSDAHRPEDVGNCFEQLHRICSLHS